MRLQCIICDANVSSTVASVENHLSLHSSQQLENHILFSWRWKYCTQKDDFAVECNICHRIFYLGIPNMLDFHIKNNHFDMLRNVQDTGDLSKYVSSTETHTTAKLILSLKDCYVLLKKKSLYIKRLSKNIHFLLASILLALKSLVSFLISFGFVH